MTRLSPIRLPQLAFGLALSLTLSLALLAAPAAHAFTMDDQSNTNSDGTAKFADPDKRLFSGAGTSKNGLTTIRRGNTTLQFGNQPSFNQRYNNNSMFEPNGRPTGER